MTRVLVTGPTGPAGQYILERLMTTGDDVRVLALPDSIHRMNFRDRIEIVPGQMHDRTALAEALDGAEVVYHAALAGAKPGLAPERQMEINGAGTRCLCEAAAGGIRRLVLVSSNNVYTPHRSPATWPLNEDAPRHAHGNPAQVALGESLIAAEDAVFEAGARGLFEYAVLRPTVIAGRSASFIDQMVAGILQETANLDLQRRMWDVMQWIHGSDLARAAILLGKTEHAPNAAYVAAGTEPVTIYDVQALLWDILNVGREAENPHREIASMNNLGLPKFRSGRLGELGWQPEVGMRQMLMETLGRLEFTSSASLRLPAHMVDS